MLLNKEQNFFEGILLKGACRERIPKKRLEAIPFARFCISCQREIEMSPMETLC